MDLFLGIFFKPVKKWYFRIPVIFLYLCISMKLMHNNSEIKYIPALAGLIIYCRVAFSASWIQSIFWSLLSYLSAFFTEMPFMLFAYSLGIDINNSHVSLTLTIICALLTNVTVFMYLKKRFPPIDRENMLSRSELLPYLVTPVLSVVCFVYMYYDWYNDNLKFKTFQGYWAIILFIINIVMLIALKREMRDKEALRLAAIRENDTKKQLGTFHDMQTVLERQSKKLHDYKNEILTIRELIQAGSLKEALHFTESLTESISVEMSAVNTNNPIVNAILNQKYRTAGSMGIRLVFTVGDLVDLSLSEEETVSIFSNLLDNAIHECERVVGAGRKAVISVRAIYENDQFELYVKNPVVERVKIQDGKVEKKYKEGHGIGLSNVRDVVQRYDGSFAIACDDREFTAAVII